MWGRCHLVARSVVNFHACAMKEGNGKNTSFPHGIHESLVIERSLMRVLFYGYHYSLLHSRVGSQEPLIFLGSLDIFKTIFLRGQVLCLLQVFSKMTFIWKIIENKVERSLGASKILFSLPMQAREPVFLIENGLRLENLGSGNLLKWPQISKRSKQTTSITL